MSAPILFAASLMSFDVIMNDTSVFLLYTF